MNIDENKYTRTEGPNGSIVFTPIKEEEKLEMRRWDVRFTQEGISIHRGGSGTVFFYWNTPGVSQLTQPIIIPDLNLKDLAEGKDKNYIKKSVVRDAILDTEDGCGDNLSESALKNVDFGYSGAKRFVKSFKKLGILE